MEEGTQDYFPCASQLIHHTHTLYTHKIVEREREREEKEKKKEEKKEKKKREEGENEEEERQIMLRKLNLCQRSHF